MTNQFNDSEVSWHVQTVFIIVIIFIVMSKFVKEKRSKVLVVLDRVQST